MSVITDEWSEPVTLKMSLGLFRVFVNALHHTHHEKTYGNVCLCDLCLATAKFYKHYKSFDEELAEIGIMCKRDK